MTATTLTPPPGLGTGQAGNPGQARAFFAVLGRDAFVTGRELLPFLAQMLIQPLFLLFIFGKVLSQIGYAGAGYAQILLPGMVAMNAFTGALQNTALPLVLDFSVTREIEDRLLAPLSIRLVAVEKMLFGAIRGVIAGLVMIPIGLLILDGVSWDPAALPGVAGVVALGSLAGAAVGMVLGTIVPPRHINLVFTILLVPLIFTGSGQFPWLSLSGLRWFQVICAANPLTYVSEALRRLVMPTQVQSIPLWISLLVMVAATVLFGIIGIRGFLKRALD
ncbi:ABC transporter permease [Amycolatopsis sp. SID8362]|uniref:ABC transporter permease n=1 Tax=Amycolatopsis sp. SID8362 TaxID=2690346 RepID=UPI001367A5C2|nr:ABC transporter permease [Amycolatopsis sp. SID8362]NBH07263.1 ABC transporter permease [Amycolatopsis sp. SID8362]NED43959.1 ABC transporter permease [Amycolatopsis sp. SID8362]